MPDPPAAPTEAPRTPESRLIVNDNPSSEHVARYSAPDGAVLDIWAAEGGSRLDRLVVRQPDGKVVQLQYDAHGRVAYIRTIDGIQIWVHDYMDPGRADVTIANIAGEAWRGVIDMAPPRASASVWPRARSVSNSPAALFTRDSIRVALEDFGTQFCLTPAAMEAVRQLDNALCIYSLVTTGLGAVIGCTVGLGTGLVLDELCRRVRDAAAEAGAGRIGIGSLPSQSNPFPAPPPVPSPSPGPTPSPSPDPTPSPNAAPSVMAQPATSIGAMTAALNATVNPNGISTDVLFEWGFTTAYGNVTPPEFVGSGTAGANVSAMVTGLKPGTSYHYRAVASSVGGIVRGADVSFTTAVAATCAVGFDPASASHPVSGALRAAVTVNIGPGCRWFWLPVPSSWFRPSLPGLAPGPTSWLGTQTIIYDVDPNLGTPRTGTIRVVNTDNAQFDFVFGQAGATP